jgi:hypothetical protein
MDAPELPQPFRLVSNPKDAYAYFCLGSIEFELRSQTGKRIEVRRLKET